MGIDIKLPIGLMFVIFGVLLTAYGLLTVSDPGMYDKSFGMNVNLWFGVGMLFFGSIMLYLTMLTSKKKKE